MLHIYLSTDYIKSVSFNLVFRNFDNFQKPQESKVMTLTSISIFVGFTHLFCGKVVEDLEKQIKSIVPRFFMSKNQEKQSSEGHGEKSFNLGE